MSKHVTAHELGIDINEQHGLFKWLLASFLMGKRIQADIAVEAYRVLVDKHNRDTPRKLSNCTHRELVAMLGEAHYVRYDESTATRLSAFAKKLQAEYDGTIGGMRAASTDRRDFERKLEAFEGVGPKTVEIFMREAGGVLF
ncbi:DNA methylase [Pseudomonas sp. CFBP 13710]|uniref:DNA methylase n=1 Tax=Pseudomonas sp. CFBP 13710 TaxID=2775311 RepID=UPI00177D3252|nr:DNA methylase [Pseudomonas sp. CFBP 13710]MBD8730310.1 DNA methylase [Pseudomonas sp. CFBP 13710]